MKVRRKDRLKIMNNEIIKSIFFLQAATLFWTLMVQNVP